MHTFSQKEFSPPHSINAAPLAPPQSSAGPPPTQVIAAHPTTKPLKPLCQFMNAWKVIPGISRWLLSVIERGYTLQFRRRPPRFNGVVQSLTSPRNAQALRQEIGCLPEKGAVEQVPPNELESGFYSRYFVVPKRDGGLRLILDLRPINRALCKRPFRMLTLKQILAQIRPGDWFASVDLKDAYFHIQIAPHHRRFLRFAFEGTAYQYSVLPFGLALATFSKCVDAALSPLRASGIRILNYLDNWLILAQSRDTLLSHIDSLYASLRIYSLGVPRAMSKQAKEHPRPESVHYISGSLHGLPGNESPPLAGTRNGHFVLPAPLQRRQLCSSEEISEAAGTHGVSFSSKSSGLITHATTAAMSEISSPLDSMDFGTFEYRGHLRLHRSSGAVAQPGSLQPGSPPRFGGFTHGGHNRRIDARLGSGVRGNASFGTVVGASDPMAHKPLGTGSSLFSSKGVSGTTGMAACTDSHRQHVRGFVHKSPGRHSFQGFVQAGSDFTAMGGLSPSLHQSNAHPRSSESRGGHAFEEENPSRGMEVTPQVGSDDLESLRESGGGFIRYERECTLPVVLLPVPLSAERGRAHSALASSQALCVSSDQNIASGVMQDQGGASVSDTHSPELAEQPWFPDLTELLVAPPWPIPVRRDMLSQADGSVWHPNPELWSLHVWLLQGCQRS